MPNYKEATVVAEAVRETVAAEETQVPQPEAEAPPSPPAPDTPEQQTEESTSEPNLDTAHEEFLRSLGATEGDAPTDESGTKPLSPEAQAEVDRVLAEKETETQKAQRELGVLNSFRDNATTLRTWSAGKLQPQDTEALVAFFRDYHGVSGQIHRAEATQAAATETVNQFYDAMAKELPAGKRQSFLNARGSEHKSQPDTVKAFLSMAREGYVPAKEVTKAKTDAVNAYKEHLIKHKLLKGHDAPPADGGSGVTHNASSDDAILSDPNSSEADRAAAFQRKHGFKPS